MWETIFVVSWMLLIVWHWTKQKETYSVLGQLIAKSRCQSCMEEKDLSTTAMSTIKEFRDLLAKTYCTKCETRISRNEKLKFISKEAVYGFGINRLLEFSLTKKFDIFMWVFLLGSFTVQMFCIFLDFDRPFSYNFMLLLYWSILVFRGEYIKRKTRPI